MTTIIRKRVPNTGELEKEEQILGDILTYIKANTKSKINFNSISRTGTDLQQKLDISQNEANYMYPELVKRGANPKYIDGKLWIYIKLPRTISLLQQGLVWIGIGVFMIGALYYMKNEIELFYLLFMHN